MKKLLLFPVVLFLFVSCDKAKDNSNFTDEEYSYTFNNNSQVDTVRHSPTIFQAYVNSGANIAFTYRYTSVICQNIADDGYAYILVFEVPAGSNTFEYNDATDMQNGKCYFLHSCFCANVSSRLVAGTIRGTKVGANRWNVEVNVTEPVTGTSLSFNKPFLLD